MADNTAAQFIGKTLAQVKQAYPNVRVIGAGDVSFMGTCDFDPTRLNVQLGHAGLKFVKRKKKIGDKEYTFKEVEGDMGAGIVVEARFG